MYFMSQDNDTPFGALSPVDVQIVSVGDTTGAGSYCGLVKRSRPGYASRTLVPRRFANKSAAQFLMILPAGKLASGTNYHSVKELVSILPTPPCVVKARAGQSAKNGEARLRFASPAVGCVVLATMRPSWR